MNNEIEIEVNYLGHKFTVLGYFHPKIEDQWYDQNGDPGTPGKPASFEFIEVYIYNTEITELIDSIISCSENSTKNDFWERLEEKCIETVYHSF